MIILGLNSAYHDSSSVLLVDGAVVAAVEAERLNRVKHTTESPWQAARRCLELAGLGFDAVDRFAWNVAPSSLEARIAQRSAWGTAPPSQDPPDFAVEELGRMGFCVARDQVVCVPHHLAHAMSAYGPSGFSEALLWSNDGFGDGISGELFAVAPGGTLESLLSVPHAHSLGLLYEQITHLLGYQRFDEYKVMGLAPYGDPSRFRSLFREHLSLEEDGSFTLDRVGLLVALRSRVGPRRGEAFTQDHKDVAAACQDSLEQIVLHLLDAFGRSTSLRDLAMAGGVALNASLNGKILRSGRFDRVYVQPASHDAGGALGAAFLAHRLESRQPFAGLPHVFLGTGLPGDDGIRKQLESWKEFVCFERPEDLCQTAAAALARGAVIGWVQGRSEFGPRSLGNRSILADPRPTQNRDRVNRLVKKRESFRPFAPSVPEEHVADYFEVPPGQREFPFMLFVVPVRKEWREQLGAVTHVDGTARIQTVSRQIQPRYWRLLQAFGELSGIPVLLNTSFNNDVEPIVDSVEDAIVAFLTTGLEHLALGDFWVSRREPRLERIEGLVLSLGASVELRCESGAEGSPGRELLRQHEFEPARRPPVGISEDVAAMLLRADGARTVGDLLEAAGVPAQHRARRLEEVAWLWDRRLVRLRPA